MFSKALQFVQINVLLTNSLVILAFMSLQQYGSLSFSVPTQARSTPDSSDL